MAKGRLPLTIESQVSLTSRDEQKISIAYLDVFVKGS